MATGNFSLVHRSQQCRIGHAAIQINETVQLAVYIKDYGGRKRERKGCTLRSWMDLVWAERRPSFKSSSGRRKRWMTESSSRGHFMTAFAAAGEWRDRAITTYNKFSSAVLTCSFWSYTIATLSVKKNTPFYSTLIPKIHPNFYNIDTIFLLKNILHIQTQLQIIAIWGWLPLFNLVKR